MQVCLDRDVKTYFFWQILQLINKTQKMAVANAAIGKPVTVQSSSDFTLQSVSAPFVWNTTTAIAIQLLLSESLTALSL